jgi:outer membrane protein OmpA-like peptidoglycan-associated protein
MIRKTLLFLSLALTPLLTIAQSKLSINYDNAQTILKDEQVKELIKYINYVDQDKLESINLVVYNDDTGNKKSNASLAKRRADNIQKALEKNGITVEVNRIYQGEVNSDFNEFFSKEHINYIRKKNRRVDVVPYYKYEYRGQDIYSLDMHFEIDKNTRAGDRIYLPNMTFPIYRSVLTRDMEKELDKVVYQLNKYKNINIEIQGHICCSTSLTDAMDNDTGKSELSTNRAKNVYNYLIMRRIDPKRLSYKGYGISKPLGLDEELDRRVELLVTKS